jgi:hypothetical protein
MWPISYKAGIKKVRSYNKKKRSINEVNKEDSELSPLPPSYPLDIWDTTARVCEFGDRDPTKFSDNSCSIFKKTIKNINIELQKAHLISLEHSYLQAKLLAKSKHKNNSRRSIYKGGGTLLINELRANIKARNIKEASEKLRKAKKKLDQAKNKAAKDLTMLGI